MKPEGEPMTTGDDLSRAYARTPEDQGPGSGTGNRDQGAGSNSPPIPTSATSTPASGTVAWVVATEGGGAVTDSERLAAIAEILDAGRYDGQPAERLLAIRAVIRDQPGRRVPYTVEAQQAAPPGTSVEVRDGVKWLQYPPEAAE